MKKVKNFEGRNHNISQFMFQINPLRITFNKSVSQSSYYVYLQKGAQVIGKVEQLVQKNIREQQFLNCHTKKFHVFSQRSIDYQWSIYKYNYQDNELQQFLENSHFSLGKHFKDYLNEFQKIEFDLFRISKEKENTSLQEIWMDLRHDLNSREFQMSCLFKNKINAKLTFKCVIKCEFDKMYEKWQMQKEKKLIQRQTKRKASSLDNKSRKGLNTSLGGSQKLSEKGDEWPLISNEFIQSKGQDIRQSQIKIYDPEGINVTSLQDQQAYSKRKIAAQLDFYTRKKSTMLSDIIEQSNQGSSHINISKSGQAQKLRSVDQIHEEDQQKISPIIKTQTFQSEKHDQLFKIKRTATLRHKTSQQLDVQEQGQPSTSIKKRRNSVRGQIELKQQVKELVFNAEAQKFKALSNVLKIVIILVVLIIILVTFFYSQADQQQNDQYGYFRKPRKSKLKNKKQKKLKKIKQNVFEYV